MPKWLQTAIGLCSLTGAIFGATLYFASVKDLQSSEQKTLQTFEKFQQRMDYQFFIQQLMILKDREYRIQEELRKNPKNKVALQDYKVVKQEIIDLQKKLEK